MASYEIGDLVVLISGSMRMAVEAVDDNNIACVWCNEGEIGRDNFDARLLKKWEYREDSRDDRRGGRDDHRGGGKPHRGDREGGGKPYRGDRDDRGGRDNRGGDRDKPKGKTGWDGKPREKKFFRKDD